MQYKFFFILILVLSFGFSNASAQTATPQTKTISAGVADFADAPELSSPATLGKLLQAIKPLFGSFSDE